MPSPLKNPSIAPTHATVSLALAEMLKLGWIDGYWINNPQNYYIRVDETYEDAVHLVTPQQVAIWIDGFVAGKGGLG